LFEFVEKGQILMPFSDLALSKPEEFSTKIKGRICVYRGIV